MLLGGTMRDVLGDMLVTNPDALVEIRRRPDGTRHLRCTDPGCAWERLMLGASAATRTAVKHAEHHERWG